MTSSSQVITMKPFRATIAPYQATASPSARIASGSVLTYWK